MELIRITIDKIIAGGDGMGYANGKVHFIPQVLPGEVVDVEVISEKKGFNRCRLVKVVEESKQRTAPFCKYYSQCGGCNMQHTTYSHELELKRSMVKDIFIRNGKMNIEINKIYSSKDRGYRDRVQFHINDNSTGFKKRLSDEIVSIDSCPLLSDGLNKFLSDENTINRDRVTLFTNCDRYYVGGEDVVAQVSIKNKLISFNPGGFFQSNLSLLPQLIDRINSYISGTVVMDLYCGIGLFSSFLPVEIKKIICVEIDKKVEPFVTKNIGDRDFNFYNMSLENYIKRGLSSKHCPDTIIVDPPRKGLSEKVRKFLLKSQAKRIIYVSCDPVTMARDVNELTKTKYSLSSYELFDFYPHTDHIESLGVLDIV